MKNPVPAGIFALFLFGTIGLGWKLFITPQPPTPLLKSSPTSTPTSQSPEVLGISTSKIRSKKTYRIFLVGDSMTFALGPHAATLRSILQKNYPNKKIVVSNYSEGSKNILALSDMLSRPWTINGRAVRPAINRDFDILVIESYGHNPLSSVPLQEGLHEQQVIMDTVRANIAQSHPNSVIILLATIAPGEKTYAKGVLQLTPQLRAQFVNERRAYIEAFIFYAKSHGLPLVDAYHLSLTGNASLKTQLVNTTDYIHPSQMGSDSIQRQLANFIINNNYLPH